MAQLRINARLAPLLVAVLAWGGITPAGADPATVGQATPDMIQRWIDELDSDVYIVRERASVNLEKAGPLALDPLAEAADSERLETATRAVRILLARSEAADSDMALAALNRLAALKNRPLERSLAVAILDGIHEKEAIAEIERLGGEEQYRGSYQVDGQPVMAALKLDRQWTGGDDGLKYVRRLRNLQILQIHGAQVTDRGLEHLRGMRSLASVQLFGTQATREGADAIAKALPNVEFDFRNGALLGVGGDRFGRGGALISSVQPQSAADQAGIRPGDMIVKFEGHDVDSFDSLTKFIAKKQVGDKATLGVRRDEKTFSVEVTFGGW